jgi:hypothetical protein
VDCRIGTAEGASGSAARSYVVIGLDVRGLVHYIHTYSRCTFIYIKCG